VLFVRGRHPCLESLCGFCRKNRGHGLQFPPGAGPGSSR
jgi:hypothetical protein